MRVCSVEGCGRKHHIGGYCKKHHHHIRTHGRIIDDEIEERKKRLDIRGQKFGLLTVLYESKKEERKYSSGYYYITYWTCRCECGTIKDINGASLKDGGTRSCGCLAKKVCIEKLGKYGKKQRLPKGQAARNVVFAAYRRRAKRKEFEWNLSDEDFDRLTQGNCFYCGKKPTNTCEYNRGYGAYIYNSIDRIDNTKGYIISNCVSCCDQCNRAKRIIPLKDFTTWVIKAFKHMEPMFAPGYVERVLNRP